MLLSFFSIVSLLVKSPKEKSTYFVPITISLHFKTIEMKLSIGFSPCPNDTFIFDALVNGKIDTEGLEFTPQLEDIQTLNAWAAEGRLDITKLSFPAFFPQVATYSILHSGAALGKVVGPLLVAKKMVDIR